MIVDPRVDDEAVTELAGGGTGIITVGEDGGAESEAGLADDGITDIVVVVVVDGLCVPENSEAVERAGVDGIIVVMVVNVIDDAEIGSDAETD
jgi:hypothetical protein